MSDPREEFDPAEGMRQELASYLAELEFYRMPFGRYKNQHLYTLPYEYLHWFV